MPLHHQRRKPLKKVFFDHQVLDFYLKLPASQSLVGRPYLIMMNAPKGTVVQEVVLSTVKQDILQEEDDYDHQ